MRDYNKNTNNNNNQKMILNYKQTNKKTTHANTQLVWKGSKNKTKN